MFTSPDVVEKQMPVRGLVAVMAPFLGWVLGFMLDATKPAGDAGWAYFLLAMISLPACLVAGSLLSITAMAMHDSCRALSWVGLIFNAGAMACLFYFHRSLCWYFYS